MDSIEQCYFILGIKVGATIEEVNQARKDRAMAWHPDRFNGNSHMQDVANEEMKKINLAYERICSIIEENSHDDVHSTSTAERTNRKAKKSQKLRDLFR